MANDLNMREGVYRHEFDCSAFLVNDGMVASLEMTITEDTEKDTFVLQGPAALLNLLAERLPGMPINEDIRANIYFARHALAMAMSANILKASDATEGG